MYFEDGGREVSYRFDITRNGVRIGELEAKDSPTITMNADAEIKTALSGSFHPVQEANLLTDRIRPYMKINGIEYPLGMYVVASVSEKYVNGSVTLELEAYDLGYLAKRVSIEERVYFPAGTPYLQAVERLLLQAGIQDVIKDESGETLQTDREDWEPGTPLIEIINQLLEEAGFNSLWFDFHGNARLTKYTAPSGETVGIVYRSDQMSVIREECVSSSDLFGKYNVFRAVVDNPELPASLTAVAVNDEESSPFSTVHIGRVQAPVERLDNIASQEALNEYVSKLKLQSMTATEMVSFTTANMPIHGVGEILGLEHERLKGVYLETEWSMRLGTDGEMSHTAKKVVYI